jgi:hypothetical protein
MLGCNDLRLGGTLGAASITGGVSVANWGIAVSDYAGLFGAPRQRGIIAEVSGRAGAVISTPDGRLPAARLFTLPLFVLDRNPATGLVDSGTPCGWVESNQDTVDRLVHSRDGFLVEYERSDGTKRFLHAFQNGQMTVQSRGRWRGVAVPSVAPYPYWRTVALVGPQTISGADTISINAGSLPVYDTTLVFSGDGAFTNSDTGQTITVAGSASAVTVRTGDSPSVTQAGSPARNLVTTNDDEWMRFDLGTVNVTSTVSVDVSWRASWGSA